METTTEALTVSILRWIENARRNNRNMLDELAEVDVINPLSLTARITDNLAKIEAWEQVLRSIR